MEPFTGFPSPLTITDGTTTDGKYTVGYSGVTQTRTPNPTLTVDTADPGVTLAGDPALMTGEKYTDDFAVTIDIDEVVAKSMVEVEVTPADKASAGTPVGVGRMSDSGYMNYDLPIMLADDLAAAYDDDITVEVTVTDAAGNETVTSSDFAVMIAAAGTGGNGGNGGGADTLAQPTNVMIAPNAGETAYTVSWTAPADTTGINGYYVSYNPVMHVSGATTTMVDLPAGVKPTTSVSVWSTADMTDQSPATVPDGAPSIADIASLRDLMPPMMYDGEASASADAVTFTLTAADVAAGNHIVIANDPMMAELVNDDSYTLIHVTSGMMDLYDFFAFGGGTIELVGAGAAKGLIISEIMWGENETGNTDAERAGSPVD